MGHFSILPKGLLFLCVSFLTGPVISSPICAEASADSKKALADIREALAGRLLPEIDKRVATAKELKGDAAYEEELNRLELLAGYVKGFWNAVDKGAVAALTQGELLVDDKPISIVEYDRRLFIIRHEGQNRRYTLETIPAKLAWVLAQQYLKPEVANNKVYVGAFLLMDGKGDRRLAKLQWEEAAEAGVDVKFLLPELKVAAVAATTPLPHLSPAQRATLAPAQWQLRTQDNGKWLRSPLGKLGLQTAEGRLQVEAAAEESSLLHKTRVEGNFQCRVVLSELSSGQTLGLFPASQESPVLVPLPAGTVRVEFGRKQGVYSCRINDEELEIKTTEKSAGRLAGYVGFTLAPGKSFTVAAFELTVR